MRSVVNYRTVDKEYLAYLLDGYKAGSLDEGMIYVALKDILNLYYPHYKITPVIVETTQSTRCLGMTLYPPTTDDITYTLAITKDFITDISSADFIDALIEVIGRIDELVESCSKFEIERTVRCDLSDIIMPFFERECITRAAIDNIFDNLPAESDFKYLDLNTIKSKWDTILNSDEDIDRVLEILILEKIFTSLTVHRIKLMYNRCNEVEDENKDIYTDPFNVVINKYSDILSKVCDVKKVPNERDVHGNVLPKRRDHSKGATV